MPLDSSPERPVPLGRVVSLVRQWIDRLGFVWVEAQLIQVSRPAGQSVFLTFRDRLAQVSANVRISATTLDSAGPISPGATVVARLKPSYYEQSGQFTFFCDAITPVGEGRLLAQLEQTRRALQAEGLFDPARKRRLPVLPRAVGLITAVDSAAERDVVENARRRWPAVRLRIRHALVQGPLAAGQLMDAVRALDADRDVEVIVIARGGGSLEDLLPFSDEGLIRTVAACRTPVISAIGHESDNPILDLVADVRASTPTDAAKRVVPDVAEEFARLTQRLDDLRRAMEAIIELHSDRLAALRSRPVLADPTGSFALRDEQLAALRDRMRRATAARIDNEQLAVTHQLARVRAMSPKATLERGYAILVDSSGRAVTSARDVATSDQLTARLVDGELDTTVTAVRVSEGGEQVMNPAALEDAADVEVGS
jgi:exodeoxyribonuclease VII large subunit